MPKTVLIVDDHPSFRCSARAILESACSSSAASGRHSIAVSPATKPSNTASAAPPESSPGASVVMVAVFSVFAVLPLLDFKEMGVGPAAAIFIDATIVRAILLPATMKLLGEKNWYLPRWLECFPHLDHDARTEEAPELVTEQLAA